MVTQTSGTTTELTVLLASYKAAVEEWIQEIRLEEELASADLSVADVDKWEHAHFREEDARNRAKSAKRNYEDAVRKLIFGF